MPTLRAASILSILFATACLEAEPDDGPLPEADADRCIGCTWGPPILNTDVLNGLPFDGVLLTGDEYQGVTLVSITLPRDQGNDVLDLGTVESEHGILYASGVSGQKYSRGELVGSLWELEDRRWGTSVPTTMEITDYFEAGNHARYTFVHTSVITGEKEVHNCEPDPYTTEHSAIIFPDLEVQADGTMHEASDVLYFGCISGAVGKSVVWGYAPWDFGAETHQTATRVVRADYCGDGVSWTVTGTGLQLEDVFGVWSFADPGEATEAIWTRDGAVCLSEPRLGEPVQCANGYSIPDCGGDVLDDHHDATMWSKVWPTVAPEP